MGELVGKPDPRTTAEEPGGPEVGLIAMVAAGAGAGDGDAEVRGEDAGLGVGEGAALTVDDQTQQPAHTTANAPPIRRSLVSVLPTEGVTAPRLTGFRLDRWN